MRFVHVGFAPDLVDYLDGWERQRVVHAAVAQGREPDTTPAPRARGRLHGGQADQARAASVDGTPVVDVDTRRAHHWHGPGQLVGYPIVACARCRSTSSPTCGGSRTR